MNINVGNLVRIDLGFGTVEGDPLRCERKYAWGLVKEIRGGMKESDLWFIS